MIIKSFRLKVGMCKFESLTEMSCCGGSAQRRLNFILYMARSSLSSRPDVLSRPLYRYSTIPLPSIDLHLDRKNASKNASHNRIFSRCESHMGTSTIVPCRFGPLVRWPVGPLARWSVGPVVRWDKCVPHSPRCACVSSGILLTCVETWYTFL